MSVEPEKSPIPGKLSSIDSTRRILLARVKGHLENATIPIHKIPKVMTAQRPANH